MPLDSIAGSFDTEIRAQPGEEPLWAVVLAGGDGSRLSGLTRGPDGVVVPKQFCSLDGGPSLLQSAIDRAVAVAGAARTSVVVTEPHRRWWASDARMLPTEGVCVQPQNRGTAVGILLALLRLMERGSNARVVLLPADHFVEDERLLRRAVIEADLASRLYPDDLILLGMAPEWPDPELGYILPAAGRHALLPAVERFVEKPAQSEAERLVALGALWNAFIVVAPARVLLESFMRRMPQVVEAMRLALMHADGNELGEDALAFLYRALPSLDFSRDLLEHESRRLRVAKVPHCGWTDLGTPARLAETLRRSQFEHALQPPAASRRPGSGLFGGRPVLARQVLLTDAGALPRRLTDGSSAGRVARARRVH